MDWLLLVMLTVRLRRARCCERAKLGEVQSEGLPRVIADGQQLIGREQLEAVRNCVGHPDLNLSREPRCFGHDNNLSLSRCCPVPTLTLADVR
jgi:hypothetical protein